MYIIRSKLHALKGNSAIYFSLGPNHARDLGDVSNGKYRMKEKILKTDLFNDSSETDFMRI